MAKEFFEEQTDQSVVKAKIVGAYFGAWAKVMLGTVEKYGSKLCYLDFYAGPGRYRDGSKSTPLNVASTCIENPRLAKVAQLIFNDGDAGKMSTLETELQKLDGIETLKHKPAIYSSEITKSSASDFLDKRLVPTFSFIDPFGYKGLSLDLIKAMIANFGCDCVFFFNYNRINAGINNPIVEPHMQALFGQHRLENLKAQVSGASPRERKAFVLESITEAIRENGGNFVLPFVFRFSKSNRVSHFLIFVTKHFKGYEIMKGIMATQSSVEDQGVSSFEYSQADARTPLLFSLAQPFDSLKSNLLLDYAGQTTTRDQLYQKHSIDTPYLKKHYTRALKELESDGKIQVHSNKKRNAGTFAAHTSVTFPEAI